MSLVLLLVEACLDSHFGEKGLEVLVHLIGGFNVGLVDSLLLVLFADLNCQFEDFPCEVLEDSGQSDGRFLGHLRSVGAGLEVGGDSSHWEDESCSGGS